MRDFPRTNQKTSVALTADVLAAGEKRARMLGLDVAVYIRALLHNARILGTLEYAKTIPLKKTRFSKSPFPLTLPVDERRQIVRSIKPASLSRVVEELIRADTAHPDRPLPIYPAANVS